MSYNIIAYSRGTGQNVDTFCMYVEFDIRVKMNHSIAFFILHTSSWLCEYANFEYYWICYWCKLIETTSL